MRKYLIGLVIALGIILAGLIIVFGLVLNGTITRQTFEAEKNEISIPTAEPIASPTQTPKKQIVVLDPGHGKDSGKMNGEEKTAEGWIMSSEKDGWGNGAIGNPELCGMTVWESDAADGILTEEAAGIRWRMETGILSRK